MEPSPASITQRIVMIRGEKVMLDRDLAELYGVETRVLVQAVKRNAERFPDNFMFQLNETEHASLRSQTVILKKGRGQHVKFLSPMEGLALLKSARCCWVLAMQRRIAEAS